jgi:hypothetical protein
MSGENLRTTDWQHRLHVLCAWRICRRYANGGDRNEGAIYRAVLDGCAITVRALCSIIGVDCNFIKLTLDNKKDRAQQLLVLCDPGKDLLNELPLEDRRCLLEVLYLGNRAVAHPKDGKGLDHKAGEREMTSTINTVLKWLTERKSQWPELERVSKEFLEPIVPNLPAS